MANRRNLIGEAAVRAMSSGGGSTEEIKGSYTVNLNSNWQNSSINPDSNTYNSYESYSNMGTGNSGAIMYIDIKNYRSFKLYIRSFAESSYDYVMVSQLDKTITYSTSYSDTSLIKAHTRGNQQSGTALSNYTLVEFTAIDGGEHRISIIYRKDGSVDKDNDKGYVLIAKDASDAGDSSGNGVSNEGPIDVNNYLTIVALEDGLTAKLSVNSCEYCVDGDGNWKILTAATNTETINTGQTLSFRGNLIPNSSNGIGAFTISKSCNLEGNCMSMLFGDDASSNKSLSGKNYAFRSLFNNSTTIKSVSTNFLPATTLADYCYGNMFYKCTSLTQAPELPATTLASGCYQYMFNGCTSLTTAPELPATTLASSCYAHMFEGCISLTTAPELPATTLKHTCYYSMFQNCTNLTTAPELPFTTVDGSCCVSMFQNCTNLTTPPSILPATKLTSYCYNCMFQNCTSLTASPALPATTLASTCYAHMFNGTNVLPDCSNINFSSASIISSGGLIGLFAGTKVTDTDLERILPKNSRGKYCLPATTLASSCYQSMFYNCKNLTTAPELPATTLASGCYAYMFWQCSNLTTPPVLPATTLASSCYQSMFQSCDNLTTAPELPATTLVNDCYDSMFQYCSKLNYIKAMFTTTPSTSYTDSWVAYISSTGTFVKNKNATWNVTGKYGIPSGWTVQTV